MPLILLKRGYPVDVKPDTPKNGGGVLQFWVTTRKAITRELP